MGKQDIPAELGSASPAVATAVAESALPLDDRIDELRGQFPILSRKTYLNSNSPPRPFLSPLRGGAPAVRGVVARDGRGRLV